MSQENVKIVKRMLEAFNGGDADGALSYFAEDWVGEDVPDLPDRATYQGREGVRERERHFRETWGDWAWEPVEFIDAGDDVVIAVITMRASGRGSDVPIEAEAAFVYEVHDGMIIRDRPFTSKIQALEAAGLSE